MWYWHKNRHIDQWNRIESPETNPCVIGQSIYDRGARISCGERIVFSINGLGKLDIHMQKDETRSLSYTTHKINSKWLKDSSRRPETIKLLEKNRA